MVISQFFTFYTEATKIKNNKFTNLIVFTSSWNKCVETDGVEWFHKFYFQRAE